MLFFLPLFCFLSEFFAHKIKTETNKRKVKKWLLQGAREGIIRLLLRDATEYIF